MKKIRHMREECIKDVVIIFEFKESTHFTVIFFLLREEYILFNFFPQVIIVSRHHDALQSQAHSLSLSVLKGQVSCLNSLINTWKMKPREINSNGIVCKNNIRNLKKFDDSPFVFYNYQDILRIHWHNWTCMEPREISVILYWRKTWHFQQFHQTSEFPWFTYLLLCWQTMELLKSESVTLHKLTFNFSFCIPQTIANFFSKFFYFAIIGIETNNFSLPFRMCSLSTTFVKTKRKKNVFTRNLKKLFNT